MKNVVLVLMALTATALVALPSASAVYLHADFTYSSSGRTVYFEDTSSGLEIVRWQWTFGDKNVSEDQNPVHSYPGFGTYVVNLTVTNTYGVLDTRSRLVNTSVAAAPPFLGTPYLVLFLIIAVSAVVVGIVKNPYARVSGSVAIGMAVVILVLL